MIFSAINGGFIITTWVANILLNNVFILEIGYRFDSHQTIRTSTVLIHKHK